MQHSRNLSGCQVFQPSQLPKDWVCAPLKDRLELLYGRALKEELRQPGDVDVFGSNGKVGTHNVHWLDGPGVLVGRKGTVGAVHYTEKAFWPIDTVYYVKPTHDERLRYLYYLLDYLPLKNLNAATGVPGLSRRDAYALRGAFPSADEQAAIATILGMVDTAMEQARWEAQQAQALQTSLLTDAFEAMKAERKRLGDFTTDVRYGTSRAANEYHRGNPTLRIPNVISDQLTLDDLVYVDLKPAEVARLLLQDGDLLLVRTNGNPNYVGRSAVFKAPDDRTWIYASYLIRVRLNNDLSPNYANVFLSMERGRRELLRRVTTSAGNHNINSNSIRLLSIPVPATKAEQERIVEIALTCRAHVASIRERLAALGELKKSLMHDLLTGTVRVHPASISELTRS